MLGLRCTNPHLLGIAFRKPAMQALNLMAELRGVNWGVNPRYY